MPRSTPIASRPRRFHRASRRLPELTLVTPVDLGHAFIKPKTPHLEPGKHLFEPTAVDDPQPPHAEPVRVPNDDGCAEATRQRYCSLPRRPFRSRAYLDRPPQDTPSRHQLVGSRQGIHTAVLQPVLTMQSTYTGRKRLSPQTHKPHRRRGLQLSDLIKKCTISGIKISTRQASSARGWHTTHASRTCR